MAENGYTRRRFGEQPEVHELLTIGTVPKNQRGCYRVRLTIIDGRPFADLRVYTKTINEELRPTVKGVAIRADALPEVIKALIEAATFIDD